MRHVLEVLGAMSLVVFGAAAQEDPSGAMRKVVIELQSAQKLEAEGAVMGQPVIGAPYSATEVDETTQTLADGTKIHNEHQTQVYRDGAGRTRRENGNMVTVMDPVAKVRYAINTERKTAFSMPLGFVGKMQAGGFTMGAAGGPNEQIRTFVVSADGDGPGAVSVKDGPDGGAMVMAGRTAVRVPNSEDRGPQTLSEVKLGKAAARPSNAEDLGPQTMEGLLAQGTRTTRTIEAGAIGNDRPISIISERWYSPQLQTVMMTRLSDPRMGETTFHLTNVKLGEPDPSLFQVPAGYQVTERK